MVNINQNKKEEIRDEKSFSNSSCPWSGTWRNRQCISSGPAEQGIRVEATTAPAVAQPTAPGVALWSVSGQWVLAGAVFANGNGLPGGANLTHETGNDAFYIYSFKILPDSAGK